MRVADVEALANMAVVVDSQAEHEELGLGDMTLNRDLCAVAGGPVDNPDLGSFGHLEGVGSSVGARCSLVVTGTPVQDHIAVRVVAATHSESLEDHLVSGSLVHVAAGLAGILGTGWSAMADQLVEADSQAVGQTS